VTKAREIGNPIKCIGPWSASQCFESLGKARAIPKPDAVPFGITSAAISFPTHFVQAQQFLAGSAETRSAALTAHPKLMRWVKKGGLTLVAQEPGAGGSTLLAAITEAAKERGLYYDAKFARRPRHLDLQAHVKVLAWQLGLKESFRLPDIFERDAVVAIDDLEQFSDHELMLCLQLLARAQLEVGRGALIICTHLNAAKLEKLRNVLPWLPKENRTYRLSPPAATPFKTPTPRVQRLLRVLGLATSAVPWHVALSAAGLPSSFDRRHVESWVEWRGERAALRANAAGTHLRHVSTALAAKLGDALVKEAHKVNPLRRMAFALEAEHLYFLAPKLKLKAFRTFLMTAEAGLSHGATADYFKATLSDYLRRKEFRQFCKKLSRAEAQALAALAIQCWHSPGWPNPDPLSRALGALLDRPYVDQALIQLRLQLTEWERGRLTNWERGRGNIPNPTMYEDVYERARLSGRFAAARAELALAISGIYSDLGEIFEVARYRACLKWTRCAKEEALRARARGLAGMASDNEVAVLLKLGRLKTAERILKKRIAELGKEEGFSDEKAVTFGNLFHLALQRGLIKEAEAHFFEVVLQNAMLNRWHGLVGNLELLKRFAEKETKLPKPELIGETQKQLAMTRPIFRF
jgi:hypothetical protein